MSEPPFFEVRITTGATGTILRAATESLAAGKAEDLIRRAHHRGSDIALTVSGSDARAVRRIELYLASVIHEVEQV
ncbi:hypothetical protein [Methylobacterium nonmethylotrophicum]|uniref:Uncharacterized protein n=1 Tax=Methylobacterium nonmethylotrophicum TaxID=1141884 RepID=A0A4Z0NFG7_9HYPH|nr:hypothetical protein [Methylobacterium nonmethylotrophicum]TGD94022.1 hypothetical protein EU555_32720 [Methylobacterium nonmethylotrophicum]